MAPSIVPFCRAFVSRAVTTPPFWAAFWIWGSVDCAMASLRYGPKPFVGILVRCD